MSAMRANNLRDLDLCVDEDDDNAEFALDGGLFGFAREPRSEHNRALKG